MRVKQSSGGLASALRTRARSDDDIWIGWPGPKPSVYGHEGAGVVEKVGFGVTTLREGDEVYGMPWFPRAASGYAEYVTAPARQFARKPSTTGRVISRYGDSTTVSGTVVTCW